MDRNLALEAVRVTEAAALASARLMGRGDVTATDRAGAEAMHRTFQSIGIDGTIVISEGQSVEQGMLALGERVGNGSGPRLDVALDPLEGAAICATGGYNALSIVALAEPGGFLRCPDTYMEKIAVGPKGRGVIDLEKSSTENLRALADTRHVYMADLTVAILDRPRHEELIAEVRKAGARVRLLNDGDVAAALATTRPESGIDMLLGTGGARQGVLAAAGLRCAGGEIHVRFRPRNDEERAQVRDAGITDFDRVYTSEELVSGSVMFAGTGVSGGDYLAGVRFSRGGARTNSVVMRSRTHTVRILDSMHRFDLKPDY